MRERQGVGGEGHRRGARPPTSRRGPPRPARSRRVARAPRSRRLDGRGCTRGTPVRPTRSRPVTVLVEPREVKVHDVLDPVEHGRLEPGLDGVRDEDPDPGRLPRRPPGPAYEQHLGAGRLEAAQEPLHLVGQPAVDERALAPRAGVLDRHEGVDRRGGAGDRLVAREAGSGAAERRRRLGGRVIRDPQQALADQAARRARARSPRRAGGRRP